MVCSARPELGIDVGTVIKVCRPCVRHIAIKVSFKRESEHAHAGEKITALFVPFNQCTLLKIKLAISEYKSHFPKYIDYYLARSSMNSPTRLFQTQIFVRDNTTFKNSQVQLQNQLHLCSPYSH